MRHILTVTVRSGENCYAADLTLNQAKRYDNGALVSCGLTVPDDLPMATLKRWLASGIARPISKEKYQHSGCQSSCVLRGDVTCRW